MTGGAGAGGDAGAGADDATGLGGAVDVTGLGEPVDVSALGATTANALGALRRRVERALGAAGALGVAVTLAGVPNVGLGAAGVAAAGVATSLALGGASSP